MCGIIGAYGLADAARRLGPCLDLIRHRGPDGAGLRSFDAAGAAVTLGHRRLAIVDLSDAAGQPFEKDGLVLCFNGEIYNHAALREELGRAGISFQTRSDTEVLLESWRCWGAGALSRLRGMFAFALLDLRTGELVLARDPFGIKPLFLHRTADGAVIFASELKAIRPMLADVAVDPAAMVASLMYQWIPEDRCILAGVEKLPAGHVMRLGPGAAPMLSRYWDPVGDLAPGSAPTPGPDELRTILEEAVRCHLVADVPMASLLSGGLDSSLITAVAARTLGGIDAFTIGFRSRDQQFETMPDDLVYARRLARLFPIRLHEIELEPDVAALLPATVHMLDEPVGDPAAINLFLLCRAARDAGAKVLLSGMGADELFGGYRRHQAMMVARYWQGVPGPVRRIVHRAAMALPVADDRRGFRLTRWAQRFLTFADLPEEEAYRRSYTYYDPDALDRLTLSRHGAAIGALCDDHRRLFQAAPDASLPGRMCFTDVHMFLPGLNLTYSDRASMAASVELRVPFVDTHVAQAAFRLRPADRTTPRRTKIALKRAAEGILPRDFVHRPKASFGAPLRSWLRNELKEMVDDLLPRGRLVSDGWVDQAVVATLVADDRAGRRDNALRLWQLMTAELWLRSLSGAADWGVRP
ncbi:MAG: hypothetical protein RLY86_627 [Pseudomonadota bacterium]|jgi:asparagine synthase (glutamine-hydrolysing)